MTRSQPEGEKVLARDLNLLLVNRLLRALAYGASAVIFTFQLEARGLSAFWIGVVLTLGLGVASIAGLIAAAAAARFGRRRSLAATGLLMALAGLDLALAPSPWQLGLASLTGMMAAGAVDIGPFLSLEQAMLTESAGARFRNRAFGRYALTGALAFAAGAAIAGLGGSREFGSRLFLVYALIGLATAVLPMLLSRAVEGEIPQSTPAFGNLKPLLVLSGLFSLDAFGGGWIVQPVLVYWLHIRFGADAATLGPALAAMNLLSAASYEAAGRIADRIGLINTMFFTHLPSNVVLMLVPFSPNLAVAIGVLLVRFAICNMDSPARQAYVVSIVPPSERAGAVAITRAIPGLTMAVGPILTGLAIQSAQLPVPFLVAGAAKIVYDLVLYTGFRSRRASHERPA